MTPHWHPSPNFGPRKGGAVPSLIVVHYTAMDGPKPALDRLCDPAFEVSAHYLIGQGGQIWQMVDEAQRAWHAGRGAWGACTDINSASIGIELCNRGDHPYPQAQIDSLITLMRDIQTRHDIPPSRVIGHSDMAPDRKIDPGRFFPWSQLAQAGVAIDVPDPDQPIVMLPFGEAARRFGYPMDAGADAVLDAFRQRFRPTVTGPITDADRQLMSALAAAYPVDAGQRSA